MTREEEILNAYQEQKNSLGNQEHSFMMGAKWADETMLNKACEWLYDHLYTRRDEQSPTNHFVCSKQEMLTQTEFVEQFRKAMEGGEE